MKTDGKYSVLIVDDDPDILELISDCLSDLPYDILTANTAGKAIDLLREKDITVLICDLHIAGDADGNQILATAHSANDDLVTVLMSGRMERDAMIKALNEGGVWHYLEKPLELDELRHVVEESITRYIRHRAPRDRLKAMAAMATARFDRDRDGDAPATLTLPIQAERKPDQLLQEKKMLGDRYRLMAVLGDGGTGTVYRAQDTFLHMVVALKLLHPHLTTERKEIAILKEEARIAMTLSHRNIVRLYNLDVKEGRYFLVMEYVEGCTLNDIVAMKGVMPIQWVTLMARSCASALSYAHEHGVVHQDLKPENLLLSDNGILKVIDFGLACLIGKRWNSEQIAGTPVYMSPEQKHGLSVDARTDIYSLGLVLYELLTGRMPFPSGISPTDALHTDAEPLTGLPDDLLAVLRKATAPDPDDRWNSVMDFVNAFAEAGSRT
jgi:DNA-binding response OmpR family regulator